MGAGHGRRTQFARYLWTGDVISELLWMIPDSLGFVLFNKIAAAADPEEQAELVERLNRIVFWTMTASSLAMAAAGPWVVILLYGQQYSESPALALLMIGTVTFTTHKVLTKFFAGTGFPHYSRDHGRRGGRYRAGVHYPMITLFGAAGAAIAHSACYTMTAGTAVYIPSSCRTPPASPVSAPMVGYRLASKQQVRLIPRPATYGLTHRTSLIE